MIRDGYRITIERGDLNYGDLERLYRQHYSEMQDRLRRDGVSISDYNPRIEDYFAWFRSGKLLNFVVRFHGVAVGYSNIYLTNDMHNDDPIASEDTIYILPEHRNGIGKELAKHILAVLRDLGVKRVTISPVTDLRVGKIWQRMGFKPVAQLMTYTF